MVRSLGYKTDLFFRGFEGEILERDYYTVIRTPKNPTFRWGNFLLFKQAPTSADFETWQAAFKLEHPEASHIALGWDDPENTGDVTTFTKAGFDFDQSIVMSAKAVHPPPKINSDCQIRAFKQSDWRGWADMECAVNDAMPEDQREGAGYRMFLERKGEELERMSHADHGTFWGAFLENKLVASMGLYFLQGVGRFQWVGTHPEFRRQGLCSTLVHHVAKVGLEKVETLVMVADPGYVAAGIYESLGFRKTEKQFQLEKFPI
jgi:ribosomal protein S18 acetylase RimI-like enzyme